MLVLDGLGDKGIPELGQRTPLQAAFSPNLDKIAESGVNGLYLATAQGITMLETYSQLNLWLDNIPSRK